MAPVLCLFVVVIYGTALDFTLLAVKCCGLSRALPAYILR